MLLGIMYVVEFDVRLCPATRSSRFALSKSSTNCTVPFAFE
jgi:hypothetical protein